MAESVPPPPHKRRPRYKGTHPRSFEERYKELDPEQYPEMQEHVRAQGRTPSGAHVPVMLNEVMELLDPRPGDVVADCTVGYGGHAMEFLRRIGPEGLLAGCDVDAAQLDRTRKRLESAGMKFRLYRSNFAGIAKPLAELGIEGYNVILADLGVSSMQIDDPARGFSYKHDGPLDMRMDDRIRQTAADLLRTLSEEELAAAFHELGDEPDAEAIAQEIVRERDSRTILRTHDMVSVICRAKGIDPRDLRGQASHPAAPVFQALRMLVNDELGALKQLLRMAPHCLRPGGRIGIISFHSGEDRLVKHSFRDGVRAGIYAQASEEPMRPSAAEVHSNPRSRSAKLRVATMPSK